jgi:diguanylate cyclase (GGDEF)-like protein/PAS domain S-box-containing protein
MSFILISSIIIRLAAFGWSILLLRQLRDWRMAFLSGMLALMALRQILTMTSERESWAIVFHWHIEELPGLLVSVFAFLAVFYLKVILAEHNHAVAERHKSEIRMASILGIVADAIITIDKDQHILQFNQGAEQIFGYQAEEVLGQPLDILLPSHFVKIHRQHIRTFATASKSTRRMGELSQEIFGQRKDGSEFPADASISRLRMDNRITFTVILRDITERKRAEANMEHLALYDTLTNLPNRTLLHELLQRAITSPDSKTSLALLFIGVDRFKAINETLGHPVGDHVLQKTAKRLQQFAHGVNPIARPGGDVFTLLVTPLADSEQAFRTAHEILDLFSTPITLEDYTIDVEMSIGISLYPDHGEDADTLMERKWQWNQPNHRTAVSPYTM